MTQFDRVVQREKVALARLREEIAKDVTLWTEIMEGRLDNRNAAHILELAVSSYEAPHRWREWGGDWILATEMNEFLELLKERQLYWKNSFVQNERKVWWGALSRPASLLGVVVFDSGERIFEWEEKICVSKKDRPFFFKQYLTFSFSFSYSFLNRFFSCFLFFFFLLRINLFH